MKERVNWISAIGLVILAIIFFGFSAPCDAKSLTFKFAHVGPAKAEHPWHKFSLKFAEEVEKSTEGRIKIKIYPASQLGGDREVTESIQYGTGDFGLVSTIAMGNFVKELGVWDLPYIWPTDNAKVDKILEGSQITERLVAAAEKKRINILGFFENDWRSMTSSNRAISCPNDLQGQKIRVVENKPSMTYFKSIGAIPTPMSWAETYTALQQGTVDAQDNGAVICYGVKIWDVQKFYTSTQHIYCPMAIIISNNVLSTLSVSDLEMVRDIAVKIAREQRAYNREMNAKYTEEIAKNMVVTKISPEGLEQFQKSAILTYKEMESIIGKDIINLMLKTRASE